MNRLELLTPNAVIDTFLFVLPKVEKERMKFILFWYLNDWGLYGRRNEMFARELAERECVIDVLHIEPPLSIYHLLKLFLEYYEEEDKEVAEAHLTHIKKTLSPLPISETSSLRLYTPMKVFPLDDEYKVLKAINKILIFPQLWLLAHLWDEDCTKIGVIYPPQEFLTFMVRFFDFDLIVSDIVDYYPEKRDLYRPSLQISDFAVAVAERLTTTFGDEFPVFHLPNGVKPTRFTETNGTNYEKNGTNEKKIAGWVGNVNDTLNFSWIEHTIKENPDVEFLFVGPISSNIEDRVGNITDRFSNVQFLGPKKHTSVPAIMADFDIGLIPDRTTELAEYKDTMKLYEYLACGIPIVTSNVPPAEKFEEYVYIPETKEEFARSVGEAADGLDASKAKTLRDLAESNSWGSRIDFLLEKIKTRLASTD